ncbi:MAG: glycosyltransferase family 4 protein [Methanophagales archaeon]|nr:glycosyltransferase family 4 protein [Methanophagales archaeon]
MKIALLTTWFPPFIVGSGNRFYEIGKRISKKQKHEVHIYTTGIKGSPREEEMDGMFIHRGGIFDTSRSIEKESSLHNLKFSTRLLREIKQSAGFDIIDCNIVSKMLPYVAYCISKSTHSSLIETWHEVWYKENFTQYNAVVGLPGFFLELVMPKLSEMNVAVSETTKRRLVDLLRVNPDKVVVISNGVDLKRFKERSGEKKYCRILYVGRLESHKCVGRLILAYKRLKKKHHGIELVIVGSGPEKKSLRRMTKELNLEVEFLEPLPYERLVELMKSAWVLVLPSVREGQGIVLLEAMAAGTPPVAVNAPGSGVVDAVTDGYNGLLAPSAGERELESAIERLLTNEDLYERLRKNGLEFVKKYDWEVVAKRTEEVYEQARAARARAKKGGF